MRILLTGRTGQIGWELERTLATLGDLVATDRRQLDLVDPDAIRRVIRKTEPNLIVNAAAFTDVDLAESEPETAMAVNGVAPGILAEEARRLRAALVHYSTDYVFDGTATAPYTETDRPNPINVYGRTKLAGEQAIRDEGVRHLILRTSWVYGGRGENFLQAILRLASAGGEIAVATDQTGSPTWSRLVAEATAQMLAKVSAAAGDRYGALGEVGGTYHLTAADCTTRYEFARSIVDHAFREGLPRPRLVPITSADADRPIRNDDEGGVSSGGWGSAYLYLAVRADK